ncbi:uncharacterized protein LOC143245212 isoform X2 [Tachypleus tridentatus]|uniref:uncharacterized protein LOC143245212 isoform X2 n=1 Tax=Tachypleus tridentatus TaxID=6853 RepID=UPI003FD3B9D3
MKLTTSADRKTSSGLLRTFYVFSFSLQLSGSYGCQFPARWTGLWFQKGLEPPIRIEGDTFSWRGKCIDSEGALFLIDDSKLGCSRCVVIYEKHPNVLQYRETFCEKHQNLDEACAKLSVDAHLHSMFRVDAAPVPCPFKGPLTFSYSRGHGECKYPLSTVDSCTDNSKLLFRFKACVAVLNSESSEEELTCVAMWKEGSSHYLVGKMMQRKNHRISYEDEDTYRCFIYDTLPDSYLLSQSADATCDGLVSPREGYRVMELTESKSPGTGCDFPEWVTVPGHWHTLDDSVSYVFSDQNNSFRINHLNTDNSDTTVSCAKEVVNSVNTTVVVAYSTSGCENGFVCIIFHLRDKHITELQIGKFARRVEDACQPPIHVPGTQEYITLVTSTPDTDHCPALAETNGLRIETGHLPDKCTKYTTDIVGCRSDYTLEVLTTCASYRDLKRFQCHGTWEEKGRTYIVTGLEESRRKVCFVFSARSRVTLMSGLHGTCSRSVQPGVTGNITFNITAAGDCDYPLNLAASFTYSACLILVFSSALTRYIR